MCKSSHFVGVVYLDGLKTDASTPKKQVVQKILCEFENRFQKNPDENEQAKIALNACRIKESADRWSGAGFCNFNKYCDEAVKDLESLDSIWIRSPKKKEGEVEFTGKVAVLIEIVDENSKCTCGHRGSLIYAVVCGAIAHC